MIDDRIEKKQDDQEIVDVQLGFVEKRKFRIEGDYNRILELNTSDLNTYARMKESYPKLQDLLKEAQSQVQNMSIDDSPESLDKVASLLTDIDNKMRELVDYIFDTNASAVCAPSGNMFDPVGGSFRYERVLDVVSSLYTTGLNAEFEKMKNRVEKKTSKYTRKYHK